MKWRQHEAINFLEINGDVVANVFPYRGAWAVAMQGEEVKTARHKFQAKEYAERHAMAHFAKLQKGKAEFVPDHKSIEKRERVNAAMKREKMAQLEF